MMADNGRFADKGFRDDVSLVIKLLPFVELVAIIRTALLSARLKILHFARTLLLHAKRLFPKYILTILWPYAVTNATRIA